MRTISEKRRRRSMLRSVVLLVFAAIVLTPKVDQITLPDFGMPFVAAAVASEADRHRISTSPPPWLLPWDR
jgi:hypothetical protein